MQAEACAVCALPAEPQHLLQTGGNCNYPTCCADHNTAICAWLAYQEISQDTPNPADATDHGDPISHVPQWLAGDMEPTTPHAAQVRATQWLNDAARLLDAARRLWAE